MALTIEEQRELEQLEAEENSIQGPSGLAGRIQKGEQVVERKLEERGDESFGEAVQGFKDADTKFGKFIAGLNLVSMPFERFEAGFANAAMALQDGKPEEMIQGFTDGARGKKLGQVGDLYRKAGAPEWVASTMGLVTTSLPIFSTVTKSTKALQGMTGLSKFTDKGLRAAGKELLKGSDDAVAFVGKNLDNAYAPINNVAANLGDDGLKLVKAFDDAPEIFVKHVEKQLGKNIDEIATLADVRKLNSTVGKLKPTSFGKAERGIAETIDVVNINKIYSTGKKVIQETLESNGFGKQAKHLLAADDAFSATQRSADFIRKGIVDSTLRLPTKAGVIAGKIKRGGDLSSRTAINQLLKGGKAAKKSIMGAINHLDKYNKAVALSEISRKVLNYSILGGVAGSIGSRAASNTFSGNDYGTTGSN